MNPTLTLTQEQASRFARLALAGIRREYPNAPQLALNGPEDLATPRALHPAFFGCYDWHSAVHSHWMLVRLLRIMPELPEAGEIRAALGESLTEENLRVETAYFNQPGRRSFERMYGWAWLLKLAEELYSWEDEEGREWGRNVAPLAELLEERYIEFLPKQTYPIRVGTHPNTAFGLLFALDYARALGREKLASIVRERSFEYYGEDRDCPASWEPDGNSFFSPCLIEADLMRRVLGEGEFREWLGGFMPGLENGEPKNLFTPAVVADRTDGQIVHLDGLNLSRAWCMRGIATLLEDRDPRREKLIVGAAVHAEASLPHITSGDYMGEHWLASFAVYTLSMP